jgi:hypothetical protein
MQALLQTTKWEKIMHRLLQPAKTMAARQMGTVVQNHLNHAQRAREGTDSKADVVVGVVVVEGGVNLEVTTKALVQETETSRKRVTWDGRNTSRFVKCSSKIWFWPNKLVARM